MDNLLLLSGNDIPFIEAQLVIHQPTLKEIAYIGEEAFFMGCELLNFSKNILLEEDKTNLKDKTDFDILIAILREQNAVMQKNRNCVLMVLALLFPTYSIQIKSDKIEFKKESEIYIINNKNFEIFRTIMNEIFSFKKDESLNLNPSGDMARKIAEKLKKRHQKLAETQNKDNKKISVLNRYISILAVGEQKDMNSLFQYTVYQLYDEYERFCLKENYNIYTKAKLAGAKDLKEIDDWMEDIHSKHEK